MAGGPRFTGWAGRVLDLTAGRVQCQSAEAALTSSGLKALIVFARTKQKASAGTYYVPGTAKDQRQFRCTLK
jgi:hypothetical protein